MARKPKTFKRRLFGYQRKAVDAHLAVIDDSVLDLQAQVDRVTSAEHHELVLRATRLSVEETLQSAHAEAEQIRTDAEAEASRLLADAYDLVAARQSVIDLRADQDDADEAEVAEPAVGTD